MRRVPTTQPIHAGLWAPASVEWENLDATTKPWDIPGYGVNPTRLGGRTLGPILRLAQDRYGPAFGSNSYELDFLPPARLPLTDVVVLDTSTAHAFSVAPGSSTYPGTGTHFSGAADRDLLLVMPTSGPRTAAIHVWGYRGVYLLGGVLKPLPDSTATTIAAVNATTLWRGMGVPMVRVIPHPDAVSPFVFLAGLKIQNDPSLHASSGGVAYGSVLSVGSFSITPANLPDVYFQNMGVDPIPGWHNSLNVGSANNATRSSVMGFGEGGINKGYYAKLDVPISYWGRITTSPSARPTALGSPTGYGKLLLRDVQYRPYRDTSLYPSSSTIPLWYATAGADVTAGNYHESTLDNVWSTPHPSGRTADFQLVQTSGAPANTLDRGDYLEWTAFTGTGREGPPMTGRLDIGESPDILAPSSLYGLTRVVASLATLDTLIAGG